MAIVSRETQEALDLLQLLEKELAKRRPIADRNEEYYQGTQPLRFASEQFQKYNANRYTDFSDNWCGVVADSPTERLDPIGIRLAGETPGSDKELWRAFQENGGPADVGLAFLGAINTSRSFGLVWGDEEDNPEITFEDSRQAIVGYEPGSRRKRKAAAKIWADEQWDYATLYTRSHLWKWKRSAVGRVRDLGIVLPAGYGVGWEPREVPDEAWPLPNPLGVVPMVELQNRPRLAAEPLSDIGGVVAMQDAVNVLWANLFVTADSAAFPQRMILNADMPTIPILDDMGQKVGERPIDLEKFRVDRMHWIEGENATAFEFSAANLENYTKVIEVAIGHIAAQTRTPQHYLIGKMANLSAEALKAAETGLVKKVQEKQLYFGEALKELFLLVALVQDQKGKAKAVLAGKILWKDAESRSEAQLVDALLKLGSLGFPFEWIAERYGIEPPELERILRMRAAEAEADLAQIGGIKPPAIEGPPSEDVVDAELVDDVAA